MDAQTDRWMDSMQKAGMIAGSSQGHHLCYLCMSGGGFLQPPHQYQPNNTRSTSRRTKKAELQKGLDASETAAYHNYRLGKDAGPKEKCLGIQIG